MPLSISIASSCEGSSTITGSVSYTHLDVYKRQVYLNGAKIGYIYRGTVQDMFNDYTKRGWRVSGYLNKYSVSKDVYKRQPLNKTSR